MNNQNIFDSLQRFDEDYIPFPPFVEAMKSIEYCIDLYRQTGLAENLIILGESGTGKSTLCRLVEQKYPRFAISDRDILPALMIEIPPSATIASVADALLTKLGDPGSHLGTVSSRTSRVITLCKACKIELVLFDEAQHIHDRGQAATHYMVGDWLKNLIDKIGVPTIFLGLPRLEALLQVNEQLRRRFSKRMRLALGQSDTDTIATECLQLFNSLGSCIPIPLSAGCFGWDEFSMRLYYASDGRVAYIKKLLAGALRLALELNLKIIQPAELETVFTNEIWWEGIGALNPFNSNFVFRRLDRGNEPFERARLTPLKYKGKSTC